MKILKKILTYLFYAVFLFVSTGIVANMIISSDKSRTPTNITK